MWLPLLSLFFMLPNCYCPEFLVDKCILSSVNHTLIIDLSRAHFTDHSDERSYIFQFTLCPDKKEIPHPATFACLDFRNGTCLDIGSSVSDITFTDMFNVTLKSDLGIGSVLIYCNSAAGANPPVLESIAYNNASQNYEYEIRWISATSCPRNQYTSVNSCVLYTKSQSFDMRPLQHSKDLYYEMGSKKYYINLCKNVTNPACPKSPVCLLSNKTSLALASTENSELKYIEGSGLALNYMNLNGGHSRIVFICSLDSPNPVISQVYEENHELTFNIKQPLTCPPLKMECWIYHQPTIVYDLFPLHRISDNWQLNLKSGYKIIFNMCGPLNYVPNYLCSGRYFACLLDETNTTLAFAFDSQVSVNNPGQLSLHLTGNTTYNHPFLLNISLECAKLTGHPVLNNQTDTDHNVYNIYWKTDAACPSQMSIGKQCSLNDMYRSNVVDLSPLHKLDGDYLVTMGNESFRINLCGNLNRSCGKIRSASVCYKNKDGEEIAIGQLGGSEPIFKDGQFMFYLFGAPCNNIVSRSIVKIIFSCEYAKEKSPIKFDPEYIQKANDCEFYFYWRTDLVCTQSSSSNCSINGNGNIYDLSPLKNIKENYVVEHNNSEIVLNVCHSVIPGHRIRCGMHSGACLVNDDIKYILSDDYELNTRFENLGRVSNSTVLEFKNNKIYLNYIYGGICKDSAVAGTSETVIIFECDAKGNDKPELVSSANCKYEFKWLTPYACPKNKQIPTTSPAVIKDKSMHSNCSLTINNKRFDFSNLMGKEWLTENRHILLGVCQPVESKVCPTGSGACVINPGQQVLNIGDYNENLIYDGSVVYLDYISSETKLQTKIEFICSKTNGKPKFVKKRKTNDGYTTYYILWPTHMSCDENIDKMCCSQIGNICDEYTNNYNVSINSTHSVALGVCKPLMPVEGLLCHQNTASCIATKSNKSYEGEQSLGRIFNGPTFYDNSVYLEYLNGSVCENDVKYSTVIRFFCDNSSMDYPKFVRVTDKCRYEFEWGTNLLCNRHQACSWPFPNEVRAAATNIIDTDQYINGGEKRRYVLNLCNPSVLCGSYLCRSSFNDEWRTFVGPIYKTEPDKFGIRYYFSPVADKTEFVSVNHCGALVEMRCDNNKVDLGSPVLEKEDDCYVHIVLKGELGCMLALKDTSEDIHTGSSWYVIPIFLIISVLLIVPFLLKAQRRGIISWIQQTLGYRRLNIRPSAMCQDSDNESALAFELHEKRK